MNAAGEDLDAKNPMSSVYKMMAAVMLQNGFDPGFGLGRDSQGIIELILVLVKGSRYGLGYIPTNGDMKIKKKNAEALTKRIQHMYQFFPFREYAEHEDLRKGVCDLFEEIDVVIEEEVELDCICDAKPGGGAFKLDFYADPNTQNSSVERRHSMHIKIGGCPKEARDPLFWHFLNCFNF